MANVENHLLAVILLAAVATVIVEGGNPDANVMMSKSSVSLELVLHNLAQENVSFQLGTSAPVVVQTGQSSVIRPVTVNLVKSPIVTLSVIVNSTSRHVPVKKVLPINLLAYLQRTEVTSSGCKSLVLTALESWRLKSGKYLVIKLGLREVVLTFKM